MINIEAVNSETVLSADSKVDTVHISPLIAEDVAAVSNMTFPAYRPQLTRFTAGEAHDEIIALVARENDVPVGLALAQVSLPSAADCTEQHKVAYLLSISVISAWRQCGVASRLMRSLEEALIQRGCTTLTTKYTTQMPACQLLERLLAACCWSPLKAILLMSTGLVDNVMKAPWLAVPFEPPPGFELFEWSRLNTDERAQLQDDLAAGKIPNELSPFGDEEYIEPAISVGVRHKGEVVAWMIVIRSPWVPDALCYRSQYVRPQLRGSHALGPLTLAEAIYRHAASPVVASRPVAVFGMSLKSSTKQVNFFRKRLAPYCFSTYESRWALKFLN